MNFVSSVDVKCKTCGSWIWSFNVPDEKYSNWKIINGKKMWYCRRCRKNVKAEFDRK